MMNSKIIIILILTILCCGQCYKFLGVFPVPIKSHMAVFVTLMKELARRGHNVTVVSTFPEKNPLPNYRDVDLSEYIPKFVEVINMTVEEADSKLFKYLGPLGTSQLADIVCEGLSSPPFQNFLKENESFDGIIIENFNSDCFLSIASKINAPIIGFSSSGILPWMQKRYGNPTNPAYIPSIFMDLSDKMTFLQRVENTLLLIFQNSFHRFYRQVKDKEVISKYIGDDATDLDGIIRRSSMLLANIHFTVNLPRPLAPNVIEVGGIHIVEPKSLPMNLKNWIEDSSNGIIYFSMGSMTKGQSFPAAKLKAFINAFELLPQRVIWKWENDTMKGKTEKILLQKWLPQLDLLCHPNVKLFVSHGGMLGIMEAVYCGVPILLMPQYGDQNCNAKALEATGAAVILRISEVTEETAYLGMMKALQLRDKMKSLSNRFKDRPLSPLETAVYWTEYVVRQNGAPFMKTAAVEMPFYQYYLLDVLLFIFSVLLIVIFIIIRCVKVVAKFLCKSKVGKQKRE